MSNNLQFWHGAHRWDKFHDQKNLPKGKCEYGPGLYLTTNYNTAAKYAKGNGKVILIELTPEINWLQHEKRPFSLLREMVNDCYHLKGKQKILNELEQLHARLGNPEMLDAEYLVNLFVNNDVSHGNGGRYLQDWLLTQNIDASLANSRYNDDWVVIFNEAIIKAVNDDKNIAKSFYYQDFKSVKEQIQELQTDLATDIEYTDEDESEDSAPCF